MNYLKILMGYLNLKYSKYALVLVTVIFACYDYYKLNKQVKLQQTIERQVDGFLSQKEIELTAENKKLNLANSKLIANAKSLEEQARSYREKYQKSLEDFDNFNQENNLLLQEFRHDIFTLKQKVVSLKNKPPETKVIVKQGACTDDAVVAYSFLDQYSRLYFSTPNCLSTGQEEYVLNQAFSIYGEVYEQEDGALKVSSLNLNELNPENHEEIIASAELFSSEFKYIPRPKVKTTYDLLTAGVSFTNKKLVQLSLGYNLFNFSTYYLNLSINLDSEYDFYPGLNFIYRPEFLTKPLNLGLHLGTGYSLQKEFIFYGGVNFFVW